MEDCNNHAGERYPMCEDQLAQVDCRKTACKYNTGAGACANISPAITLNGNGTFVCWTEDAKEEKQPYKNITLIPHATTEKQRLEAFKAVQTELPAKEEGDSLSAAFEKAQAAQFDAIYGGTAEKWKIGMYKGEEVLPLSPPMPPAQFFEQRPDGRWQRFKQDYFPQWLLRRFPVRYKMPLGEQIQQLFDDCSGMPSTARGNKP